MFELEKVDVVTISPIIDKYRIYASIVTPVGNAVGDFLGGKFK
ncbi:hypothetical protein Hsar01_01816 [Haloferula sargassicola]|uniref:Uncharacterized protein n=1 Tax=Haloferula sargassicola TaxID=490096 RepID=A0ABP9ULX2_9BACT